MLSLKGIFALGCEAEEKQRTAIRLKKGEGTYSATSSALSIQEILQPQGASVGKMPQAHLVLTGYEVLGMLCDVAEGPALKAN